MTDMLLSWLQQPVFQFADFFSIQKLDHSQFFFCRGLFFSLKEAVSFDISKRVTFRSEIQLTIK